jgi:uncharacterized protein (TIGR02145 family)
LTEGFMNFFTRQGRTLLLSAAVVVGAVFSSAFALDSAFVPVKVNVHDAAVEAKSSDIAYPLVGIYLYNGGPDTLRLPLKRTDGVIYFGARWQANAPAIIAGRGGNITVNLPAQSYKSAEVALYTVNGKRILRNNVFSSNAVSSVSRRNVATGIYLLSVKGADGKAVTARLTHSGGRMNINAAFSGGNLSDARKMSKKEADAVNEWTITVWGGEWAEDSVFTINPVAGINALLDIRLRMRVSQPPPAHVHDWGNWVVTAQATCEAAGVETRTCTLDASHKETRAVAKLTGAACESVHVHDWGDWVVTAQATCESAGAETRTCKLDASHKETRAVAQLTGAACNAGGDYESVTIGGLKWIKKNLNIETADSWCYANSADSCAKYGRLYKWNAAKTACQSVGMRLPTNAEWGELLTEAGGERTAGNKLKSTSGWYNNGNGTDQYGFSALPGGGRITSFIDAGKYGYWWTATESDDEEAYGREMIYPTGNVPGLAYPKNSGFSARCVKTD